MELAIQGVSRVSIALARRRRSRDSFVHCLAWFRLKFPHLTRGSVSSSGVAEAILAYTAFDEQVETKIRTSVRSPEALNLGSNVRRGRMRFDTERNNAKAQSDIRVFSFIESDSFLSIEMSLKVDSDKTKALFGV